MKIRIFKVLEFYQSEFFDKMMQQNLLLTTRFSRKSIPTVEINLGLNV